MLYKSRLSQRIILSVVVLTTVVSGLFALGLTATIHFVEQRLVSDELRTDFVRVFTDYRQGRELRLDEGSAFFPAGPDLPDYLRAIPTGYTEIVQDDRGRAYYVYHQVEGDTSYFLVKDQSAFEQAEILLQRAVVAGFALSVLGSLVLGLIMVKQVIAPVRRLTRQVTERKDLPDEPRSLAAGYADDEVGALAEAFDATFDRLQQALRREALFTSDVSHELRTPLMVIQSACEVLGARKDVDDSTRQRIAGIERAVKEMKALVETFLALARGRDHDAERATLAAIVRAEFPNWERMAVDQGSRLALQKEAGSAALRERTHPAVLLRTVLDNLVRNAIHHSAGGDILLVLTADGFELQDTGTGIAPEEMSRVFQPYYRGAASHREGLGLGLSLVQRICEREEWAIALEPNRPRGCRFRVKLG